ncbi:MAG: CHAT domain-containing protein [Nannocystaceae bacterium]
MSGERLSILLATARPDDQPPFRTGRKVRALRGKLSPLIEHGLVTLAVEPAVQVDRLKRLLRLHRPQILHIVCHGLEVASASRRKHVLALEDQHGGTEQLDAHELHEMLIEASPETRLVLLEACSSAPIARGLCLRNPNVVAIGMREKIEPRASTRFFLSLHEALAAGRKIDRAFAEARRDMELFAPSLWTIPMLFGGEGRTDEPLTERPRASSFGIEPSRVEDYVRVAAELEASSEVYGRDEILRRLDRHWFDEGTPDEALSNVVHLRGAPGCGKTAILARWLALQQSRGWCGATRVFSWCFDPLARESGAGDVETFFRAAYEFFGGLDPHLRGGTEESSQKGEWLEGLRLARIIRHERVLLCLDHVPTLPHVEREAYDPYEVFTPGIAALLHELNGEHAGLCIMTSRLRGELALDTIDDEPVDGIDREAALELLEEHGVVEPRATLESIAAALEDDPLMLTLAARALASGALPSAEAIPSSASPLRLLGDDPPPIAASLLRVLALRGGALDAEELWLFAHELRHPRDPSPPPIRPARSRRSWDGFAPEFLAAIRRLQQLGLIEIAPNHSIKLAHSALLHHIDSEPTPVCRIVERSRIVLRGPTRGTRDVPAFVRTIRAALRSGQAKTAFEVYRNDVCRVQSDYYERNYLTRKMGAIGDSLCILAEMFEPASEGGIGRRLRPELLAHDDIEHGLLHHHLGLAQRHLGNLHDAADRLRAAFEAYEDREGVGPGRHHDKTRLERAATCANDRAEVLAWLGDYDEALQSADLAVARAEASCDPAVAGSDQGMEKAAVFVCRGTRGHIHHLRNDLEAARTDFDEACRVVEERNHDESSQYRHLFSRPGYYYWHFLLAEIDEVGSHDERATMVETLALRLEHARQWHRSDTTVARVSQALDSLIRGRLLLHCHEHGIACPKSLLGREAGTLDEKAFGALGSAIHVFRANQHLWMLPEALRARARAFEAMEDPVGARFDERDAAHFDALMRRGQGVPRA